VSFLLGSTAEASVATLQADLARTEMALEQRTSTLLAAQVHIQELEQAQAAAAATRDALEGELARAQQALRERDAALVQARTDFAAELDKQRASTELAETRLQAAEKRTLLELKRERAASMRLQRNWTARSNARLVTANVRRPRSSHCRSNWETYAIRRVCWKGGVGRCGRVTKLRSRRRSWNSCACAYPVRSAPHAALLDARPGNLRSLCKLFENPA